MTRMQAGRGRACGRRTPHARRSTRTPEKGPPAKWLRYNYDRIHWPSKRGRKHKEHKAERKKHKVFVHLVFCFVLLVFHAPAKLRNSPKGGVHDRLATCRASCTGASTGISRGATAVSAKLRDVSRWPAGSFDYRPSAVFS